MKVYLDNAATTPLLPASAEAMRQYYIKDSYNPSAAYSDSKRVRKTLDNCREKIAQLIGASAEEIFFTSGGTESDNWACHIGFEQNKHCITSAIEHKAVLMPFREYSGHGGRVDYILPGRDGIINPNNVKRALKRDTGFISIMTANNEIGTIEPIKDIGHIAREYDILFHTDAVQAFGHIPVNVDELCVDMLSVSAHKFRGPKGCGFLYIRKGVGPFPMIYGGGQEMGMRSGTENVPGIVGMTVAAQYACQRIRYTMEYERKLQGYMLGRIQSEIRDVHVNGSIESRLANNINIGIKGIDAGSLLVLLDMDGIDASSGSACSAANKEPSHVLRSVNCPPEYINGSIRMTIDSTVTMQQADYVISRLKYNINELRK